MISCVGRILRKGTVQVGRVRLRTDVMVPHECKYPLRVVRKRTLPWCRRASPAAGERISLSACGNGLRG